MKTGRMCYYRPVCDGTAFASEIANALLAHGSALVGVSWLNGGRTEEANVCERCRLGPAEGL